jgi:hypothetical protein
VATWDEAQRHLRAALKLTYDLPTWCGLRWRMGAEHIDQRVELTTIYREPWLEVVTEVGEELRVPLREALETNMSLPMGGLAIDGGRYMLRYQLPLAGLRLEDLTTWMERLAGNAARLRGTLGRRADVTALAYCVD